MRRVRNVALLALICLLFACSKTGKGGTGTPGEYDSPMGEGNIPIAEPGSELKDVNFAFDSSSLSSQSQSVLRENSRWLLDNPEKSIVVEGHCDERGTSEYNMALGLRRAQSVEDFLRTLGVDRGRMKTVSYGEELPLDPASNESAWSRNRRAHFAIQ